MREYLRAIGTDDIPHVIIEDQDEEVDPFIPTITEEQDETLLNRSQVLPVVSQEELDSQLKEARHEVYVLKKASKERQATSEEEVPSYEPKVITEEDEDETEVSPTLEPLTEEKEDEEI